METSDHVSVVLPYFNRADVLVEAIDSVMQQDHQQLTLYLVNDASTDTSRTVAHSYEDERIVHVDMEGNGGVCRARNAGIDRVTSDLLAFMDSDDFWFPNKLSRQIEVLRAAQRDDSRMAVVGCGWRFMGVESASKNFPAEPFTRADVLAASTSGTGTPMLLIDRRVAVQQARFDPAFPALVERDYLLSCLANDSLGTVATDTLVLVRRGRADHVANSHGAAAAYEVMLKKYADELDRQPGLRSWYSYRAAREHLSHGGLWQAVGHIRRALLHRRLRRSLHLLLGATARRKGLSLAQKIAPL